MKSSKMKVIIIFCNYIILIIFIQAYLKMFIDKTLFLPLYKNLIYIKIKKKKKSKFNIKN